MPRFFCISFVWLLLLIFLGQGCIGDDIIFDEVPERVTISTLIDSLQTGKTHTFQATFFNNIGIEEERPVLWSTSDENIAQTTQSGTVTGIAPGTTQIKASIAVASGLVIQDEILLTVTNQEVENPNTQEPTIRTGTIQSTSSYVLEGDFTLESNEDELILKLAENYKASSSLPGLYVYLTNNPNTLNNAFEISKVNIFNGAHTYTLPPGTEIDTYNYVLYYCKPFGVKVGDGAINN